MIYRPVSVDMDLGGITLSTRLLKDDGDSSPLPPMQVPGSAGFGATCLYRPVEFSQGEIPVYSGAGHGARRS